MGSPCPYCKFIIEEKSRIRLGFWESLKYSAKVMKASDRYKEYRLCPNCHGELFKINSTFVSFTEEAFDKVSCSFCHKGLSFKKCYKESHEGGGYNFYCSRCLKKHIFKIIFLIICSLATVYLVYFVYNGYSFR